MIDIERQLEEVDREERSFLIHRLSKGKFREAEEKGEEVFDESREYYSFVANVIDLLQSRHFHRALKNHNRAFNESDFYQVSMESLKMAKENIKTAEEEMSKAKRIMDRYSHKFHEISNEGDKFEELVENFSSNKERLQKLKHIQSQFEGLEPE